MLLFRELLSSQEILETKASRSPSMTYRGRERGREGGREEGIKLELDGKGGK